MKPKTLKIIYWAVTILFFGFMLFGAFSELTQNPQAVDLLKQLGYPAYLNTILGTAKVIGAVCAIQWKYKSLREWAYAGYAIDIIGAGASFFFSKMGIGTAVFTLVFLVPLFASYFLIKKIEGAKKSA
ncbi:MAG TPA: DoxX family protein [Candidatus Nanoarchaeia archaeon]|nr:DoxX family protein [Candidatus Nanoarchaeia archaeon]